MTNSFTDDINDNFESVKSEIESIKTNYTPLQVTNAINSTIANIPSKTSDLTNDSGFITGISSANVTSALGFTPYNSTNPNGYITGVNSGDITTALGYTPTSPANVDGQWVASSQDFTVSTSVTSSPQEFNLKTLDYLPNDNNKYEVLVLLEAVAGTGSASAVHLSSDIVSGNVIAVQKSESKYGYMNLSIPVTSTLKVQVKLANVGSITFSVLGYRRIGTNS